MRPTPQFVSRADVSIRTASAGGDGMEGWAAGLPEWSAHQEAPDSETERERMGCDDGMTRGLIIPPSPFDVLSAEPATSLNYKRGLTERVADAVCRAHGWSTARRGLRCDAMGV